MKGCEAASPATAEEPAAVISTLAMMNSRSRCCDVGGVKETTVDFGRVMYAEIRYIQCTINNTKLITEK